MSLSQARSAAGYVASVKSTINVITPDGVCVCAQIACRCESEIRLSPPKFDVRVAAAQENLRIPMDLGSMTPLALLTTLGKKKRDCVPSNCSVYFKDSKLELTRTLSSYCVMNGDELEIKVA
jgi:hypothetical protein